MDAGVQLCSEAAAGSRSQELRAGWPLRRVPGSPQAVAPAPDAVPKGPGKLKGRGDALASVRP